MIKQIIQVIMMREWWTSVYKSQTRMCKKNCQYECVAKQFLSGRGNQSGNG